MRKELLELMRNLEVQVSIARSCVKDDQIDWSVKYIEEAKRLIGEYDKIINERNSVK